MRLEYFIYAIFVAAPDRTLVKLGRAGSVRQRLSEIQTGCPYPVTQVYSCDVGDKLTASQREAMMHEAYAHARLRGEWFDPWGRVAAEAEIRGLEADVYDIAAHQMPHPPRHARHTPQPYGGGRISFREQLLDGAEKLSILDADGVPVGACYTAPAPAQGVTIITKRKRLFARC